MNNCEKSISDLVAVISKFKPGRQLKKYIGHARFPNFKGLENDALIEFDFPFTAVVGANGSGKSSILHALYGMPEGESTAVYWFSTDLDPIEAKKRNPPRYIYAHWHDEYNNYVETRKARVYSQKREYEYWEPTKATKGDNMGELPEKEYPRKDKDRWNPVERQVVNLNMRSVVGAFDRAFSYGLPLSDLTKKHEEMKAGAKKIKRVLRDDVQSWKLGGGPERVFENRDLSDEEVEWVSQILGRKYDSATYIKHSLYSGQKSEDISVVFSRGIEYSEAFAGSGEVSVVEIVVRLLEAADYALVLIDEPETSLHPGAQRELLRFILEQIKRKKTQVVVSTHSIEFLTGLPESAIKVVDVKQDGKSCILNQCSPYVALNRLGKSNGRKIVYVEDPMAKIIVDHAIMTLDPGEVEACEVSVAPGGADEILCRQIPGHILSGHDCYVLLDGDKKKVDAFTNPVSVPEDKQGELGEVILQEVGVNPKFSLSGGDDPAGTRRERIGNQKDYLLWVEKRLKYLPFICPEAFLLEKVYGISRVEIPNSQAAKRMLRDRLPKTLTAGDEIGAVKMLLDNVDLGDKDFLNIRAVIQAWLGFV
ncbi:AAA family ATPase [Halomonas faecis]|uniref:AAA family ATPase n=1 Tax=Halomonas faecis TaxID=1562110 RepID=UPI0013D44A16|nr:AAA family ATPase [Halomonas faecis]